MSVGRYWDETSFLGELGNYCSPDGAAALRRLHDWARSHGASFPRSHASGPTLGIHLPIDSQPTPLWTMYLDYSSFGRKHLKMLEWSFDALRSRLPADAVATLAEGLERLPGISEYAERHGPPQRWKFPWLRIEEHLTQPGVVEAIETLHDELFP